MRQQLQCIGFSLTVLLVAGVIQAPPAAAQVAPTEVQPVLDFDVRGQRQETIETQALQARGVDVPATQSRALEALRTEAEGDLTVRWSSFTASPNRIGRQGAALTAPSAAPARAVAEGFVRRYLPLWNLSAEDIAEFRYSRDYRTRHNGVSHLTLQQQVNGIDVFGAAIMINLDAQGRILNVSGEPIPVRRARVNARSARVAQADAALAAAAAAGVDQPSAIGPREAIYFPLTPTELRLAWRVTFEDPDSANMYEAIVDAADGTLLWLKNLTHYDHFPAHGQVFTSDSPIPDTPDGTASNAPRLDAPFNGGDFFPHDDLHFDWWAAGARTTTTSNNVDAYADRNGDNAADPGSRPGAGAGENFTFPIDLTQDPLSYQAAAVANLFYWNNRLHDFFYQLGFDEAAGNFQTANFGLGGAGGDAVRAEAQDNRDGADPSLCNANMGTPGDGSPPRMQMYQCTSAVPERDGDLDNVVIGHEFSHGVHSRLVATSGNQVGNEGWADYFGLALVAEPGDPYGGAYGVGDYLFNGDGTGIRSDPYSTDPSLYRRTYADINDAASCQVRTCSDDPTETCGQDTDCAGNPPAVCVPTGCAFHEDCEPPNTTVSQGPCRTGVHRTGELWANSLWIARFNLVGRWGFATGHRTTNLLVIDGMKLSPANPTFLDGRD
ncbi:MAG: M36 family metallopeptidase, partial [Candidatus Polarisedimenticolia bacterium]